MSRTPGARDLVPRKRRSDRKHRHVRRNGKLVPYVSKRKRTDPIKCWFWEVRPMSLAGFKNWNRSFRAQIFKTVYRPYLRFDVDAERLSSKEQIGQLAIDVIGHEGSFILKLFCRGKNKFHVTNRKVASIKITSAPEALRAAVSDTFRLSRYWFWKG